MPTTILATMLTMAMCLMARDQKIAAAQRSRGRSYRAGGKAAGHRVHSASPAAQTVQQSSDGAK
jgi:hypothetical protein